MSKHNALYRRLKTGGKIKKLSGGYEIVRPLDYAENATFQRYSGYDSLNISGSDVLSAAKYDWVQSAIHVTASGLEMRKNSGKEQLIDLAAARTRNAMRTAANNMSLDLYSSGSLTNQHGRTGEDHHRHHWRHGRRHQLHHLYVVGVSVAGNVGHQHPPTSAVSGRSMTRRWASRMSSVKTKGLANTSSWIAPPKAQVGQLRTRVQAFLETMGK